MIKGKWGLYCPKHMKKSSPGGKGYAVFAEPELSDNEKKFLKDLK